MNLTALDLTRMRPDWERASDKEWAEVLSEVPLLSGLSRRELRKLTHVAQFVEFAAGETVIQLGEPANHFYVILSGQAKVHGRRVKKTLRDGDYFGEMVLSDDGRRSASVRAVSELHVMRLPRQAFADLVQRRMDIALELISALMGRVRRIEETTPPPDESSLSLVAPSRTATGSPLHSRATQKHELKLGFDELTLIHQSLKTAKAFHASPPEDELLNDTIELVDQALQRALRGSHCVEHTFGELTLIYKSLKTFQGLPRQDELLNDTIELVDQALERALRESP
jgi:CRP-like cAMP-binding protein